MTITELTPPIVRRTGSHIEPPVGRHWTDLEKLTWRAAVIEHDTGVRPIKVMDCEVVYCVKVRDRSVFAADFTEAWWLLDAVEIGLRAVAA